MGISSGKLLAAGMLGLGLVASVLSISYRRVQTQQALALWGPGQAATIATAPVVRALWFDPPLARFTDATPSEVVERASGQPVDVSRAYGIGPARQHLVADTSFDWQSDPQAEPLAWSYGLEFSDPRGEEVLVLLDPAAGLVREVKSRKTARLQPSIAGQLKTFLQKQFAGQTKDPTKE